MLVLTRRNGESLFITNDIEVRILAVKGNQVRLGVAAPQGAAIFREEVRDQFAHKGGIEALVRQMLGGESAPEPAETLTA
jgi:carbon storage regulator